ncbi:MAG: FlgO family outer membrane protein [Pirellulaceae bacterium]
MTVTSSLVTLTHVTLSFLLVISTTVANCDESNLSRIIDCDARVFIGPIIHKTDDAITVDDLLTGEQHAIPLSNIAQAYHDLTEATVITSTGLPNLIAWKIRTALKLDRGRGKIARVDDNRIHVTLGSEDGVTLGDKLIIERKVGSVVDPDSDEILGESRAALGTLEIISVNPRFSECRVSGALESTSVNGDLVRSEKVAHAVVVLPLVDANGLESQMSRALSEQIVTGLSKRNIPLVERHLLSRVLAELTLQNSGLVSPENAQQIGQLAGADAIFTGTYAIRENVATLQMRLLDVATARVLFAMSHTYRLTESVGPSHAPNRDNASDSRRHKEPSLVQLLTTGSWRATLNRGYAVEYSAMKFSKDGSWSAVERCDKKTFHSLGTWTTGGNNIVRVVF